MAVAPNLYMVVSYNCIKKNRPVVTHQVGGVQLGGRARPFVGRGYLEGGVHPAVRP